MSYSVKIERIGPEGYPHGQGTVETIASENEALVVLRRAIKLGRMMKEQMQFSIYAPGNRLVMSYTTGTSNDRVFVAVV